MAENDKNIIDLGLNRTCPYLVSQGLLQSIVNSLSYDPVIKSVFKKSIVPYERHDFSIMEMPAMCVFTPNYQVTSRNSYEEGIISIRMFFPTTTSRKRALLTFISITRYVANYLQTPTAFKLIIDSLIPLPEKTASNYDDIVTYRASGLSPLMEIFRSFNVTLPRESSSNYLSELSSVYRFDMQNWMYFLESIGIDYTDPNKVIYPLIEEWNLYVEAEEI